jgi:prophage DNA circulation protein
MPAEARAWILVHNMSVLRLELDTIAAHWQRALDADQRALAAAAGILPALELVRRQSDLRLERLNVAAALARLAQVVRLGPASRR